ncbi:MAG: hypothetical protein ABW025_16915 [Cellulomonas sp.]
MTCVTLTPDSPCRPPWPSVGGARATGKGALLALLAESAHAALVHGLALLLVALVTGAVGWRVRVVAHR